MVANLIVDSFTDGLMDPARAARVGLASDLASYLLGLADGGWSGSTDGRNAWAIAAQRCGEVQLAGPR